MTSQKVPDSKVLVAIEAIYDAAPSPAKWPQALQSVADCFGDLGAVLLWHRDDGSIGSVASPGLAAAQADYQDNGWSKNDIAASRIVEHGYLSIRDTISDTEFITDEERSTHPFYTDFSAKHGVLWRLGVAVTPDPRVHVWVALQRGHDPRHTEQDHELAALLGRHIEKSLRLSIRLIDAEKTSEGLGRALAALNVAVFTLDSLGRVLFANAKAEGLIGTSCQLQQRVLRIGDGADRSRLDHAIQAAIADEPSKRFQFRPLMVPQAEGERPIAVYLLPITDAANLEEAFLSNARVIVLIIDPNNGDPADPAVLRELLGITMGEARVASWTATGLKARETATKLGISEETVRTVLKQIYAKTHISRQSELSALIARMLLKP